jgi:hypothetical protein
MDANDIEAPLVFAGSASPRLTKEICGHLGVTVGQGEVLRFSEGTLFPRVLETSEAAAPTWCSRPCSRPTTTWWSCCSGSTP